MFKRILHFLLVFTLVPVLLSGYMSSSASGQSLNSTAQKTTVQNDKKKSPITPGKTPAKTPKKKQNKTPKITPKLTPKKTSLTKSGTKTNIEKKNPLVTIELQNGKKVKIELYPSIAPNTVNNFVTLVQKGYYNGLIFHRVIPGFMIQGGSPDGTGSGGPGYSIKGEFSTNGFNNPLKHERGIISMARTPNPDSAGSQFFIMVDKATSLDGAYAAFGKVISGMEEVDKIVQTPRDPEDRPLKEQKMTKVTIETFGVQYKGPNKI